MDDDMMMEKTGEDLHISIDALVEGLSDGLFEQLREYMHFIDAKASDSAIIATVFNLALYVFALDPTIKREIVDFLLELRKVVAEGHLDGVLSETEYTLKVADYLRRNKSSAEFNAYALRELATYLSYDSHIYEKG